MIELVNLYVDTKLVPVKAIQVGESFFNTNNKSFLRFAEPFTWIVILFVWHIRAGRSAPGMGCRENSLRLTLPAAHAMTSHLLAAAK